MRGHFCFHCQREWLDQSENQRERPKKQKIDGTQPPPPSFDIDRIDQWGARIKSPTKSGQAIVFDARPPMKTSRPAIGGQWRPLNQTTKKKNNRKAKKKRFVTAHPFRRRRRFSFVFWCPRTRLIAAPPPFAPMASHLRSTRSLFLVSFYLKKKQTNLSHFSTK